jgi:cytochrome c oxidase subunit II
MQILPGYETVFTLKPTTTGSFGIVCNEYCGIGHHQMLGKLIVK